MAKKRTRKQLIRKHHARLGKIDKAYEKKVKRAESERARQERRAVTAIEKKLKKLGK